MVVHNGIITNYKEIKQFLVTKGFTFVKMVKSRLKKVPQSARLSAGGGV